MKSTCTLAVAVLLLLLAVTPAWPQMETVRHQRAAAELRKLGAKVVTYPNQPQRRVEVNFKGQLRHGGEGLKHLKDLDNLYCLWLAERGVTDKDLQHLSGLNQLRRLSLRYTRIGDQGLEHLKGLTRLYELSIGSTLITDAGLVHLEALTDLKHLYLDDTLVSDAGLARLQKLPRLQSLWLSWTPVTDAGLVHLKNLKNLKWLTLHDTAITDAETYVSSTFRPLGRLTEDRDFTGIREYDPQDALHGGGFPGTIGPQESVYFPFFYCDIDPF